MARVYNFSAGPAMLPEEVLERAREQMLNWQGSGTSVMEMSHRGEEFISIAKQAEADLRELMSIPETYEVLFLQGGASAQFAQVPLNLLGPKRTADYVNTGAWSKKAIAEAKRLCRVRVVASGEEAGFVSIPPQDEWDLDPEAAYVHYTPNETIGGVEFHWIPKTGEVPLVADMSSTILSRPVDVTQYGLIYAGAQKNIGPAGLAVLIIREDLLSDPVADLPRFLAYKTHADAGSMYNTPPTYAVYMAGLVFDWLKRQGGLAAMGERNQRQAERLYAAIDESDFYANPVARDCRSWMNVPFTLADADLDAEFLAEAKSAGLVTLKGHRSVGGMRASIYNAMPDDGVDALISFMEDFADERG